MIFLKKGGINMTKEKLPSGIGFFEKYLTIWVAICMVVGVLIGVYLPEIPKLLGNFEYANVSVPVAVLIWLMIYPMMLKVDFNRDRKSTRLNSSHL